MNRPTKPGTSVDVGWKLGLLLGGAGVVNHSLEVFASLQPPLPAIRGVAMWAVMFLVCGAASSIAYSRTHTVRSGIIASILAAFGGATILVLYAIAVGLARGEPLSLHAVASIGGMHLGGSLIVGFAIGLVSGSTAEALDRMSRPTATIIAIGLVVLLTVGLFAIAHATQLSRSLRPPFIMVGLPAIAIALAVAAPTFSALLSPQRTTRS